MIVMEASRKVAAEKCGAMCSALLGVFSGHLDGLVSRLYTSVHYTRIPWNVLVMVNDLLMFHPCHCLVESNVSRRTSRLIRGFLDVSCLP